MVVVSRGLSPDSEVARAIEMRRTAMASYIEAECAEKWRRALNRRTRPERDTYDPGDRVYFWRAEKGKVPDQSWHGPARVIQSEPPSTVWCSFQGGLWKCSPEQRRPWTAEEKLAWETVPEKVKEAPRLGFQGRREYVVPDKYRTSGEL